jgi:hypothetical protein
MSSITVQEIAELGHTFAAVRNGKVIHVKRADNNKTVCGKVTTGDVLRSDATDANICVACRIVIQKGQESQVELTEVDAAGIVSNLMESLNKGQTETEGNTEMAEAKSTDKHAETVEQIAANIERAGSLAEAENTDGLEELGKETETLISGLPTRGKTPAGDKTWAQFKQESRNAFRDAATVAEKPKAAEVVVLETTEDYREVEGMDALIDEGAGVISEGVTLHLKASQTAYNLGRKLLDVRLKLKVKGAPDLKAKSQAYRDASGALKAKAIMQLREGGVDEFDAQEAAEKLWKSMNNQTGDVLADYAKELDGVRRADFDSLFTEVAKAHPALEPSEAVSAYYGIDLVGPREKARLKAKAKAELAAKAQAALEAGKTDEAEELEHEAEALDGKKELTLAEKVAAEGKKLTKAVKVLDEVEPDELTDEERKAARDQYNALRDQLKALADKFDL